MTPERSARRRAAPAASRDTVTSILGDEDASLLDIVDNALTKGVVLTGDVTIGLAHVDLVYARLSLLLCAADRVMPGEHPDPLIRHHDRYQARMRRKRAQAARATASTRRGPREGGRA